MSDEKPRGFWRKVGRPLSWFLELEFVVWIVSVFLAIGRGIAFVVAAIAGLFS